MSCNSCNRNASLNNGNNTARNCQMYRSSQLARNGQMYRSGMVNRGMTGYASNRMNTSCPVKEKTDCNGKEEKSEDYRHQTSGCNMDSCNQATAPVDSMMVAMAYVPWQQWGDTFDYEKSLMYGTIFEDLNKPWMGRACE